jgi:4-diphosphocytidyl-2-C-methyl-D-erythritol kinase
MRVRSLSKVNLCLRLVGRYPDGYHELQSVIDTIDWGDEISLRRRRDGRIIRRHGPLTIPPEQDLVVRAARALQKASKSDFGVDISVRKRVPQGAGLGGGSGAAACVLWQLNRLWRLHWGLPQLSELALTLGADVPALLRAGGKLVAGRGEQLRAIALPKRCYVVLYPGIALSTQAMYQHPRLERDAARIELAQPEAIFDRHNSFQALALEHDGLRTAFEWLKAQLANTRLTGSGSALFGECDTKSAARAIVRRCPKIWRARVCQSRTAK